MVEEKGRTLPAPPEVEVDITPSAPLPEEEAQPQNRRDDYQHPQLPESVHDITYHPGEIVFYRPVKQRQKWGDSQILPRVNWGDTFYDLFFVAAAYNVGNILVDSPNARGVLYFISCFFPTMQMWRDKMYYDARFVVGDDIFHRIFEACLFLVGAGGIVHIGTVDIMSNPRDYPDMFAFALVLTAFSFINITGYLEVYFFGHGQPEVLKKVTSRESLGRLLPFSLNLAATIIAGIEYFVNGAGSYDDENEEAGYVNTNATYDDKDDDHRLLAGDAVYSTDGEVYINDVPIYLCLTAYVSYITLVMLMVHFFYPRDGSHKKSTIPLNIAFIIHRDGEWIMLMLGESILSLLIVDVTEQEEYYTTFFCGILTVIALQYLHYRSQPHDPSLHAMRRNKDAGIWWVITNGIYSCSLIGVGVSYKLFLYDFTYDSRRLEEEQYLAEGRSLAGGGGSAVSTEERQQAAANIFSVSMAVVFFALDVMILLHRGLRFSMERCQCKHTKKKSKAIFLTVVRIALCAFFATLSLYENDPEHLAVLGLAGVVVQLLIRRIGDFLFEKLESDECEGEEPDGDHETVDPEKTKWPNVTHAKAERESESSGEGNR